MIKNGQRLQPKDEMKYVKISESDSKLISKISNMSNYKIFGYSKNSDFQIEIDKI